MVYEIFSKLLSESLLSLYPVFVKNIGLSLTLQTWSRCFSYTVISAFFIDYPFIYHALTSSSGILLALTTIAHIYTSYRGFELLESGVAYSLFYLYPIIILLIANKQIHPIILLALFGVFLLVSDEKFDVMNLVNSPEGFIMILLAAATEAAIYFLVRDIKTTNNWNHIFISYFLGALLFSAYFFVNKFTTSTTENIFKSVFITNNTLYSRIYFSLGINTVIGLFGYLLRFYAITRLDTYLYAALSYFGIVMAFVYGIFINGETINFQKIIGAILIIISNMAIIT
jgi:drug/metabolite transporter (DMT)-like permease